MEYSYVAFSNGTKAHVDDPEWQAAAKRLMDAFWEHVVEQAMKKYADT